MPVQLKAELPKYGAGRHKRHTISCHQIQHNAINKPSAVSVWVSTLEQCDRSTDGTFNASVAVQFVSPPFRQYAVPYRRFYTTYTFHVHSSSSTTNVSVRTDRLCGNVEGVFVLSAMAKLSKCYCTIEGRTERV